MCFDISNSQWGGGGGGGGGGWIVKILLEFSQHKDTTSDQWTLKYLLILSKFLLGKPTTNIPQEATEVQCVQQRMASFTIQFKMFVKLEIYSLFLYFKMLWHQGTDDKIRTVCAAKNGFFPSLYFLFHDTSGMTTGFCIVSADHWDVTKFTQQPHLCLNVMPGGTYWLDPVPTCVYSLCK